MARRQRIHQPLGNQQIFLVWLTEEDPEENFVAVRFEGQGDSANETSFQKACCVVKEMLEEDEEDLLGWPSVVGTDSAVEILMDEGISEESMQVAGVKQELQGFGDNKKSLEL